MMSTVAALDKKLLLGGRVPCIVFLFTSNIMRRIVRGTLVFESSLFRFHGKEAGDLGAWECNRQSPASAG